MVSSWSYIRSQGGNSEWVALVSGSTPSPSKVVSPSSYFSARATDSAAEDVDNQVKDCNDNLVYKGKWDELTPSNTTYRYYGANNRHNHTRDSGDNGVNDTTDGRNDGTL